MENKINIAKLLKDCPTGMELDCTMYKNTSFIGLTESVNFPIRVRINFEDTEEKSWTREMSLTSEGKLGNHPNAKCIIFPKGKTTWEGFHRPFQDGDVVATTDGKFIAIIKKNGGKCYVCYHTNGTYFEIDGIGWFDRFATEEEKQKLFDAIKEKGYKWNPETKTLDKLIEPKFKAGDRVKHISAHTPGVVLKVGDKGYYIDLPKNGGVRYISFTLEKDYELAPSKFDINTLVPFEDKVLVRNAKNQRWIPAFWGYKVADGFVTTFGWCKYCIPYKGNEVLFKTNNDCDDYFKTWQK